MGVDFEILVHRNDENVHLKLGGDFDGSSAHQLLETLKNCRLGVSRVFVHTNCLNQIHPFGQDVFRNNIKALNAAGIPLVFTGENAAQLAPEGSVLF
jgi:anti-anti-sigma regulatory factor